MKRSMAACVIGDRAEHAASEPPAAEFGEEVGVIANDRGSPVTPVAASAEVGELLRPLAEYEQIAGGGW